MHSDDIAEFFGEWRGKSRWMRVDRLEEEEGRTSPIGKYIQQTEMALTMSARKSA